MKNKIKTILISFIKKNYYILSLLRNIRFIFTRLIFTICYLGNKVDDNLIIFESYMGRQFSCSPKAIYEELVKNEEYNNYKFVWAFRKCEKYKYLEKQKNTKVVEFGSREYYKIYSSAKYWITNSRLNGRILKKKNQIYIQCWHGTPLKKLGYDIKISGGNAMNSNRDIRRKYKMDSKRYSYMISPSRFCTEKFKSAFDLKDINIIKELGYPRNDYLYNYTQSDIDNIKNKLKIKNNKKIILYAPTWRDNQHKSGIGYTYKLGIDFEKLKKEFQDEYVILFRTHYFVANQIDLKKYSDFVIDVSSYEDIKELYIISDILITDYSSVFFDYANLKRPIIFYMYDYNEYKNNLRDFYIDLSSIPGPIVKNEEELIDKIKGIDVVKKEFSKKYKEFNNKYNYLDDGKSSQRVIYECIIKEQKE
ncbi:MAG: CDP-glycerol glycerophosphotransferase family protein [Clostridia bacterium]|nr:CDP-glycerol glycerophosphotransferase family protein [Clostridia bacterium]